jgi:hypothetical protein
MTRKLLYKDKSDNIIARLYSNELFSNITGILCGHIILGCWQGYFKSVAEVLEHFFVVLYVTNI